MKKDRLLPTLIMSLMVAFSACKKDDESATGAIDGQLNPANGVAAIQITTDSIHWSPAGAPNASGYFLISNLAPGRYYVLFDQTPDFAEPNLGVAQVVAGQTTHLGTIALIRKPSGSFQVDGQPFTASGVYMVEYPTRLVLANTDPSYRRLELQLPQTVPAGLGRYPLTATSPGTYGFTDTGACGWSAWTTALGGSGSVSVTQYDATTRKISGTFSFTAAYDTAASGSCGAATARITAGTFADVPLR